METRLYDGGWVEDIRPVGPRTLITKTGMRAVQNLSESEVNGMKDEDRRMIEEYTGSLQCTRNFKCAESGFKDLCQAKYIGVDNYLECQDDNPGECSFVLFFGSDKLCQCPLRVYLSKIHNLKASRVAARMER
jgi:hypothetical protein